MGKAKHSKEKKFDRNVEISAPILDPEVIRKIHSSPPEDKRLNVKGYGFEALLTDLHSQDSIEEVTPISQPNHLPSYIGISCAVSGYSNYSAYNRRPEPIGSANGSTRLVSKPIKPAKLLSTSTRSQTNSPASNRIDPTHIHHITIDKTHIESVDQERKELTEKLTASVSDRRRSPSPLAPLEDERHHGAYVGARYCPMPAPNKLVHKHIPLLGIDDDQDPDQVVVEDKNKVEEKIASLYGDEFVEGWKESMSHKSKREDFEEEQRSEKNAEAIKSPKSLVTLKPTPAKVQEVNDEAKEIIEIPTPNAKVLESVEKQFLTKLLTDDNPPMPKSPLLLNKSPSPQPTQSIPESPQNAATNNDLHLNEHAKISESRPLVDSDSSQRELASPQGADLEDTSHKTFPEPDGLIEPESTASTNSRTISPDEEDGQEISAIKPISPVSYQRELIDDSVDWMKEAEVQQQERTETLEERVESPAFNQESPPPQSMLIDLRQEQVASDAQDLIDGNEHHIEYDIRTQSPLDNQSSPVKVLDSIQEGNLVSFSPEPSSIVEADDSQAKLGDEHNIEIKHNDEVKHDYKDDLPEKAIIGADDTVQMSAPESVDELAKCEGNNEKPIDDSLATCTPSVPDVSGDNNNKDGHYYLDLLKQEEEFIGEQMKRAEITLSERETTLDEDTLGRIRSAIGKANLLINKKCNQFRDLCNQSINADANEQYAVLNDDLAGFWDMITIQIVDVRKSFESLENILKQ